MLRFFKPYRFSRRYRTSLISISRFNWRRHAPIWGVIVIYSYLAFHAFSGSQGLVSWMNYSDQATHLRVELETRQAHRLSLQTKVGALSAQSLDMDSLEVATRRDLFVAKSGEITIWLDR